MYESDRKKRENEERKPIESAPQTAQPAVSETRQAAPAPKPEPTDINDFEYSVFKRKYVLINRYKGFGAKSIVVPDIINGLPVVSIEKKAFMGVDAQSIVLPDSIVSIRDSAFAGCKNLTQISLPEGLMELGDRCFSDSGITSLTVPGEVKFFGSEVFSYCRRLETVVFNNEMHAMGQWMFKECTSLRKVVFPKNLRSIAAQAFEGTAIRTIVFPESLLNMSCEAFRNSKPDKICVFLGMNTRITSRLVVCVFPGVKEFYCLPGSEPQRFAREHGIPARPLSEFDPSSI